MVARIRIRDAGGALRTITQVRMRDASGTLRTLSRIRMRDQNNVLRVVFDPSGSSSFSAAVDRPLVVGTSLGTGTATTEVTTVTPTGGTSPYTYSWARLSYTHETTPPTATAGTSAATAFTQTNMAAGGNYTSSWRCTVTDSATPANTATVDVTATFSDLA